MRLVRTARLLVAPLLLAAVVACDDDDGNAPPPPAGSITLAVAPDTLEIDPGEGGSFTVTVTRENPFEGPVELALESEDDGFTAAFDPAIIPSGSTTSAAIVAAGSDVEPGEYSVTVRAKGTGITDKTSVIIINVPEPEPDPGT